MTSPEPSDLPARLAARPFDTRRGLPIPYVNEHDHGVNFAVVNGSRVLECARLRLCGLCGQPHDYNQPSPAPSPAPGQSDTADHQTAALRLIGRVGETRLDLHVRRAIDPATELPADVHELVTSDTVAALVNEYRDRLVTLTVDLTAHGLNTDTAIPVLLTPGELEFLCHCLTLTERRWHDAVHDADTAAEQPRPPRTAPPGRLDIEPTPAGYRGAARIFDAQRQRVRRLRERLAERLDQARATGEDEPA